MASQSTSMPLLFPDFDSISFELGKYSSYILNYQLIIVQTGLKDSSTTPTRKSARDYMLNVFSIEL